MCQWAVQGRPRDNRLHGAHELGGLFCDAQSKQADPQVFTIRQADAVLAWNDGALGFSPS